MEVSKMEDNGNQQFEIKNDIIKSEEDDSYEKINVGDSTLVKIKSEDTDSDNVETAIDVAAFYVKTEVEDPDEKPSRSVFTYKCKLCNYEAHKKKNLRHHVASVHEGISYKC